MFFFIITISIFISPKIFQLIIQSAKEIEFKINKIFKFHEGNKIITLDTLEE